MSEFSWRTRLLARKDGLWDSKPGRWVDLQLGRLSGRIRKCPDTGVWVYRIHVEGAGLSCGSCDEPVLTGEAVIRDVEHDGLRGVVMYHYPCWRRQQAVAG